MYGGVHGLEELNGKFEGPIRKIDRKIEGGKFIGIISLKVILKNLLKSLLNSPVGQIISRGQTYGQVRSTCNLLSAFSWPV